MAILQVVVRHEASMREEIESNEQREGRIRRQGNQNSQVRILRYATESSFDVYAWLLNRTSPGIPRRFGLGCQDRPGRRSVERLGRLLGGSGDGGAGQKRRRRRVGERSGGS
jgi:hypothetical protein